MYEICSYSINVLDGAHKGRTHSLEASLPVLVKPGYAQTVLPFS